MIADSIALLRGQILEDGDLADIGFGHFVVMLHHFLLDAQEDVLAQTPENAFFSGADRGGSRGGIDNGQLAEEIALLESPAGTAIDLDLHFSFEDDEEHAGWGALLEHILSSCSLIRLHGVRQLSPLLLAKLEEQKVLGDGSLYKLQLGC